MPDELGTGLNVSNSDFGDVDTPTIDIDFSKFDFNIDDLLRKRGGLYGSGSLLPDKKLLGTGG